MAGTKELRATGCGSLAALGLEEIDRRLEASMLAPPSAEGVVDVVPDRVPCCVCDPMEPWHPDDEGSLR
jgi:hypothetical protein